MTAAGWLRRAPGLHLGAAQELQNSLGAALRLRTWLSGSASLQACTFGCCLLVLTCAVTRAESYWADCGRGMQLLQCACYQALPELSIGHLGLYLSWVYFV